VKSSLVPLNGLRHRVAVLLAERRTHGRDRLAVARVLPKRFDELGRHHRLGGAGIDRDMQGQDAIGRTQDSRRHEEQVIGRIEGRDLHSTRYGDGRRILPVKKSPISR